MYPGFSLLENGLNISVLTMSPNGCLKTLVFHDLNMNG